MSFLFCGGGGRECGLMGLVDLYYGEGGEEDFACEEGREEKGGGGYAVGAGCGVCVQEDERWMGAVLVRHMLVYSSTGFV